MNEDIWYIGEINNQVEWSFQKKVLSQICSIKKSVFHDMDSAWMLNVYFSSRVIYISGRKEVDQFTTIFLPDDRCMRKR